MDQEALPLLDPENEHGFDDEFSSESSQSLYNTVGSFRGVFLPCICSIIGFILFTRFGYVVGEAGVFNSLVLTILASTSICMTVLSTSAILSNGNFKSKNIYYIVSKTLGNEFGGALGISFYLANIFGLAFYVSGLTETFIVVLGQNHHKSSFPRLIPVNPFYDYLYSTVILAITCIFTILGSKYYDRSLILIFLMQSSTIFIIVISFFLPINKPAEYTGFSLHTLKQNMFSDYTNDASGSIVTFQTIFGIIYPAVTGTQAVESINDNIHQPHINIPRGALWSTLFICCTYTIFTLLIGSTLKRSLLTTNYYFLLDISILPTFIFVGMISSTWSSIVSTMLGASTMLLNNPKVKLTPIASILLTWLACQILLLVNIDLNTMSTFVSLFYLLADLSINMACLLLQLSSTPNFRPLFRYYNKYTCIIGIIFSISSMIYIHPLFSALTLSGFGLLILLIRHGKQEHQESNVSDALIYHQIRKYLLRLKTITVQHWRPQILLILRNGNDLQQSMTPARLFNKNDQLPLIHFVNDLKKSGLFILGTFVQDNKDYLILYDQLAELMDNLGIKAFVDVINDTYLDGILPLTMSAGLGGLRPNIVLLEYPIQSDAFKFQQVLKSILLINKHVALARNFENLDYAMLGCRFIDIWPLKMFSKKESYLAEYTFAIQMGCILQKSHKWKDTSIIRIYRLVMYEHEVERERLRFSHVLEQLRVDAVINVIVMHKHVTSHSANIEIHSSNNSIYNSATNSPVMKSSSSFEKYNMGTVEQQYSLINKLIQIHIRDATVLFMTLPYPQNDTYWDELEILTGGIQKPILLLRGASTVISD
eukprot:NODE_443_length_8546_cov_0.160057.p2 type:complete len:824 gc:universal NODE_443_length_8546_cov_0.160057:1530-4001(+)